MKKIKDGIFKENALFVLCLGLCPALAITTKFENAYIMGFCVFIILLFSMFVISLIKKYIPDNVKIPVYILIIGTFVTITEMLLSYYVKTMYEILGIYLPLIVVNCIVLGRCLSSSDKLKENILDAIGIGLGYIIALIIIAFIRELIGNGTITLVDGISTITGFKIILKINPTNFFKVNIMTKPAGAFLTIGFVLAFINYLKERKIK
jgi:electron transport complex protein RnfE